MPLRRIHGFSLIELAVVLCIVSLLVGNLLLPLRAHREQEQRKEALQTLAQIRSNLMVYAMLYGYLPCPSAVSDPALADYGTPASSCSSAPVADGRLPWKTLGVSETDSWGNAWRYRVDRNFVGTAITFNTNFSADALSVRNSSGVTLTTTTERPLAIVYSLGENAHADGQNASFEASGGIYQSDEISPDFDDPLIWLARPQLYERLVAAGKLP